MNTEQVRVRMRSGFRPFIIHLSDGRQFKVLQPEFILVGKGIVAVLREDDLVESLDPLHIVSVEDIKAEAA